MKNLFSGIAALHCLVSVTDFMCVVHFSLLLAICSFKSLVSASPSLENDLQWAGSVSWIGCP